MVRGALVIGITLERCGVALPPGTTSIGGRVDEDAVRRDAQRIADSRLIRVNLRWAVDRVLTRLPDGPDAVLAEGSPSSPRTSRPTGPPPAAPPTSRAECPDRPLRVLTHCNTGTLATMGGGTALGAVRALARDGRLEEVIATETRPLLQGARLTVWELQQDGLPHRLLRRLGRARAMAAGLVDAVVVGADRIAANGDTANKIGTYALACAAAHNRIPFVVVAPQTTVDPSTPDGAGDPDRGARRRRGRPAGRNGHHRPRHGAYNPAFDVTPAGLITAIVTEQGVWRPSAC